MPIILKSFLDFKNSLFGLRHRYYAIIFQVYRAKATDRLLFFVANQKYAIGHLYDDWIGQYPTLLMMKYMDA